MKEMPVSGEQAALSSLLFKRMKASASAPEVGWLL